MFLAQNLFEHKFSPVPTKTDKQNLHNHKNLLNQFNRIAKFCKTKKCIPYIDEFCLFK